MFNNHELLCFKMRLHHFQIESYIFPYSVRCRRFCSCSYHWNGPKSSVLRKKLCARVSLHTRAAFICVKKRGWNLEENWFSGASSSSTWCQFTPCLHLCPSLLFGLVDKGFQCTGNSLLSILTRCSVVIHTPLLPLLPLLQYSGPWQSLSALLRTRMRALFWQRCGWTTSRR